MDVYEDDHIAADWHTTFVTFKEFLGPMLSKPEKERCEKIL